MYVGGGSAGAAASDEIEARRCARLVARDRQREEVETFQALLRPIRDLQQKSSIALTEWLRSHGYHNHHGEWRRKHGGQNRGSRTAENQDTQFDLREGHDQGT